MLGRRINDAMVLETLRRGHLAVPPEPDLRHSGLVCRMSRYVAGRQVAVVVNVGYPQNELTVITVLEVREI